MQYLIEVQGNVKNNLKKAYVVEANDEQIKLYLLLYL